MKTKIKTFFNIHSLQKRFIAIVLTIFIIFFALAGRVFYLQIINGKNLQIKAVEQWLRDLPLSSKRGEILDCNGVSLATTITTYDVYVRARNVRKPSELASEISSLLGVDFEKAYSKVTNKSFSEILIKMQVKEEIAKSLTKFDGVYLSQNVARVYPYNSLLTQVLGYCTIDNIGQAGLESFYDKYLKGIDGKSLTQTNAQGKEIKNSLGYYIPSVAGANLKTTLDVQIQAILERELKVAFDEHKAKSVSGIVLNAKTGGILAMSCLPSFNLNEVPRNDVSALQTMSKNSTVVDVYEPGSTFKLITLAAALNEGKTNINERFFCGGRCSVDGETIRCWKTAGHGSVTLLEGFKNSCNCVFVNLALRLGVDKFYEYLSLFGIGAKTGVDIASESAGIVMPKEQVRTVDLARIGFGHAIAVTGLQMASVYAKITTGSETTPHIMQSIETEDKVLFETKPVNNKLKLSEQTISTINMMLSNNINSEGDLTFVSGYNVGGKTGTAQKYDTNGQIASGKYISSFIGTFPADNPDYVLLVCVNEPSNGAYYGGVVAKPIGERVFKAIFQTKAISPTDSSQLNNQPSILMPDVVGLSLSEACAKLKSLGLNALFDSEGQFVAEQLPKANTPLYLGEIVWLIVG